MNSYIKLLVFTIWPGIVAVLYSLMFLNGEFQLLFYKWIVFVYVLVAPAIAYALLDQQRYDKEVQQRKQGLK